MLCGLTDFVAGDGMVLEGFVTVRSTIHERQNAASARAGIGTAGAGRFTWHAARKRRSTVPPNGAYTTMGVMAPSTDRIAPET